MIKTDETEEVVDDATAASPGDVLGALFSGESDSLEKLGVMLLMTDINSDSVKPVI